MLLKNNWKCINREIEQLCFRKFALLVLNLAYNNSCVLVDTAMWWDFTVGVQRRPPVVEARWHESFGPNVLFETLDTIITLLDKTRT